MQRIRSRSHPVTRGSWKLLGAAAGFVGLAWAGARAANPPLPPLSSAIETSENLADPAGRPAEPSAARCVECHRFDAGLTHPVQVVPSMATPKTFPLEAGRVTCVTCHDAGPRHATDHTRVGIRGGETPSMCVQCHQGASPKTKAIHTVAVQRAHFVPESRVRTLSTALSLDTESKDCMGCHDGTAASEAGSHSVRSNDLDTPSDHPIGVPMRTTERTRRGDFKLANAGSLDRRVRLFNGNLGCGSCHSVYSKQPAELVMSNQKSKLCLTCHKG